MSNMEIAKEMFFNYEGSHFLMEREGVYQKYKDFNVEKKPKNCGLWS